MAHIEIHPEKATDKEALLKLCPFAAIELTDGELSINAACRMCRICIKKGGGVFEFIEDEAPGVDKSSWKGIAVLAEIDDNGRLHPVTLELLGKARELAQKVNYPVYGLVIGHEVAPVAETLLRYGADEVFVYDYPELNYFKIEPYTNAMEDFIRKHRPSSILIGGTVNGRSLAPRTAARFRTGLTADCTVLDMSENTDLDQIRPAYGGNIMAHINTPKHRPQFATVRYKIFSIPEECEPKGKITHCQLPADALASKIEVLDNAPKAAEIGIEEAEVLIVAGRGIKTKEDLALLEELAKLLNGKIASTRAVIEAGWVHPKFQIGLSGRTVKPKLIITCGVSGAIQFIAGMNNSEFIVAINSDPRAAIFNVAHVRLIGDLYVILPELIQNIKARKAERV